METTLIDEVAVSPLPDFEGQNAPSEAPLRDQRIPAPGAPAVMRMDWNNLLFIHWPIPVHSMRALIPPALEIDEHDGSAWIGIVPFSMRAVQPAFVPPIPIFSDIPAFTAFPECNVRTYVTHNGKPGIWFFSLDAASSAAVLGGRSLYHLRYELADIRVAREEEKTIYVLTRTSTDGAIQPHFRCTWTSGGPLPQSKMGNLTYFLTERLMLFSADESNRIYETPIWHAPWKLQSAKIDSLDENLIASAAIIHDRTQEPLVYYAEHMGVQAWWPSRALGPHS